MTLLPDMAEKEVRSGPGLPAQNWPGISGCSKTIGVEQVMSDTATSGAITGYLADPIMLTGCETCETCESVMLIVDKGLSDCVVITVINNPLYQPVASPEEENTRTVINTTRGLYQ